MDHAAVARALAEAWRMGEPATLPEGGVPSDEDAALAIAAALLAELEAPPCGLRLTSAPDGAIVPGPVLEGRLLRSPAVLPAAAAPHPRATLAVVGVLAEALAAGVPPRFASVHAAIDLGASRLRTAPPDAATLCADLGGLGHVVLGRAGALPDQATRGALTTLPDRARNRVVAPALALAAAADAALRLGGLPAGALLVAAGLSAPLAPRAGEQLRARIAGFPAATLRLA